MEAQITLILGGISSGKSAFAEKLAEGIGQDRLYIATAIAQDDEMRLKIRDHQDRRGAGWKTAEASLTVAQVLENPGGSQVALLDCATMWLSNQMFEETNLDQQVMVLLAALNDANIPVIVVSNEVGLGGITPNDLARKFAREQGKLNQQIAAIAETVILVTAGLPTVLKGSL